MTTKKNLIIPESPQIPGLNVRYFEGQADYPNIIAVFDACKIVDDVEYSLTLEGVKHHFDHIINCDPFTDMIFVEVDGQAVAYGRVGWYEESNGTHIYYTLGWVHPQWRRKGIGTAILKHNERRIREIAVKHPAAAPKFFQTDHSDKQPGVAALLKANGYAETRWGYEMQRPIDAPLPDAPMSEDLEVRPVDEAHYRPIWDADNEAFRDHWGHSERTEEEYQRWLAEPVIFTPHLWKIAWDADEVVGMVRNFVDEDENKEYDRKRGYTEFISVRKPWRRRGVARSLLVQSIEMFREMGFEETVLGVDTLNPNHALNLYEGVGYQVVRKSTLYRKEL